MMDRFGAAEPALPLTSLHRIRRPTRWPSTGPRSTASSAIHKQPAVKVSDDGDHEKWRCTCEGEERHQTYVPRHRQLTTSTTNKIYKQMIDCPLFGKDWL